MVSDPGEADISSPLPAMSVLTSTRNKASSFPIVFTRLNPFNLTAYGLSACCPTLKALCYPKASKDLLPGGWLTFRGGIHTR